MISLQQNGRAKHITVQELILKTFPEKLEDPKKENN